MRPQNTGKTAGAFTSVSALKTVELLDVVGRQTRFYIVRLVPHEIPLDSG
jgi:hypothetical protein